MHYSHSAQDRTVNGLPRWGEFSATATGILKGANLNTTKRYLSPHTFQPNHPSTSQAATTSLGLLALVPDVLWCSVLLLLCSSGSMGELFASPFLWDLRGSRTHKHHSPREYPHLFFRKGCDNLHEGFDSLTLPLSALPFLAKLHVASSMCPLPHVMLNTDPACTNRAHAVFIHMLFLYMCFFIHVLRSFSLIDSDTLIHAFVFLGDINTSSYIQNERRSSNSIESGL